MNRNFFYVLALLLVTALPLAIFSAENTIETEKSALKISRATGDNGNAFFKRMKPLFKLADEIELTNPQLLQLRMLYQKNSKLDSGRKAGLDLFKKLSDPELKEEDVKKMAAEAARAAEEKILSRYRMMQEVKKILTPEQLKKLEELKATRKERKLKKGARKGNFRGMKKGMSKGAGKGWKMPAAPIQEKTAD